MKKLLVLHGPNLNLTGQRNPAVYGTQTLAEINDEILAYGEKHGFLCEIFQSNHEGELIDLLHKSIGRYDGILLNAGAYSHYSFAIRDAIEAISLPCVEVHLSNIHAREDFRAVSVLAPVCAGSICGFGKNSYLLGIDAMGKILGEFCR